MAMAPSPAGCRQVGRAAQPGVWAGAGLLAQFARYFDVELREVPMEAGRYLLTPAEVLRGSTKTRLGWCRRWA